LAIFAPRRTVALALAAAVAPALCGSTARTPREYRAVGSIVASRWPYVTGSALAVRVDGFGTPYHVALVGKGNLSEDGTYSVGDAARSGSAMLVAGNANGLAARNIRVVAPPAASRPFVAVASYDTGIVLHDAQTFSVLGVLGTGGTPSDVAIDATGRLAATDTQGSALTIATLAPWKVARADGVVLGDEVAVDEATHAVFVTDRDVNGDGALTRVSADASVSRVVTGRTAEGLAIDPRRGLVYVANVNDGTVAAVGTRSMQVVRRFTAVARVFSLALSPDGQRLYAVSNQSAGSPFGAPGSVVALDLRRSPPRIVARSRELRFPLGAALDAASGALFVTDEAADTVDVLDARTLAPKRAPLQTCRTPWKPMLDRRRLFVPCARADSVDVFDVTTLRRVPGAPFATGSYPLAVAVWPGRRAANAPRR